MNEDGKKTEKIRDEKGLFAEGNPGGPGRPKGSGISITTEIKKKLEEKPEGKNKTYLAYLIEQIMKKAVVEGDQQTIKQIWNYIDGMPEQSSIIKGDKNNPLTIDLTTKENINRRLKEIL